MRTLLTTLTLAALVGPAAPAAGQVYPDRVRIATRTEIRQPRVERYTRSQGTASQMETISRSFRLGASGEVDLQNIAGDITVTRGGGDEVTIQVVKTARARTDADAKEALGLVEVDLMERAGRVEARTRYPRGEEVRRRGWRGLNVNVVYTVTAPERARIIASSVSGGISVKDIKGDLSLETVSGDVRVANAGRVSKAKTASGDVEILDTTLEGVMDAATISGTMLLRNVKARRLDVGSVSGPVVIENVECERLEAETISGDVRFTGPLVRGGRYDLSSHSGEVRVTFTGPVGFELDATSFSGVVRTDLELKAMHTSSGRGRGQRALRGVYGDGSAVLDLTSFSGSVVVSRK